MNMRTILATALAVTVLAFGAVHARPHFGEGAGPMMGGGEDGPGMMLPVLLRSVHLTPEQEAQVKKIMADRRAQGSLAAELRAAQGALLDRLFAAGDLKAIDVKPELDRLTRARQQLMEHALGTALEVRKVLTPEQLTRAAQVKDRMRALRAEMRQLMEGAE
jgi:Spy/CpxP family protein refolding chaperone